MHKSSSSSMLLLMPLFDKKRLCINERVSFFSPYRNEIVPENFYSIFFTKMIACNKIFRCRQRDDLVPCGVQMAQRRKNVWCPADISRWSSSKIMNWDVKSWLEFHFFYENWHLACCRAAERAWNLFSWMHSDYLILMYTKYRVAMNKNDLNPNQKSFF